MKQLWCAMSLMAGSLLFTVNASADVSSGALLQQMNQASQSLNYELSFISINKQGVESLRYRHARLDKQPLAQLLQMDGPRREVVQRGNEISYFEPGLEPFTLNGDYIVDSLPSLIYTDFKRLSPYYDFISVGRTRIADRLCEVLRVVARDGTRYSYIVWMDAETKLPMRVDLLDRDGETLEQFRVISFTIDDQVGNSMPSRRGITSTLTGRPTGSRRASVKSPAVDASCPPSIPRLNPVFTPTACSASRLILTGQHRSVPIRCCVPGVAPSAPQYGITQRSPLSVNCRRKPLNVSPTALNSGLHNDQRVGNGRFMA